MKERVPLDPCKESRRMVKGGDGARGNMAPELCG